MRKERMSFFDLLGRPLIMMDFLFMMTCGGDGENASGGAGNGNEQEMELAARAFLNLQTQARLIHHSSKTGTALLTDGPRQRLGMGTLRRTRNTA